MKMEQAILKVMDAVVINAGALTADDLRALIFRLDAELAAREMRR